MYLCRKVFVVKKKNKYILINAILILLAVMFTFLVKMVDVKPVGADGTNIGFATLNRFIFDTIGVNMEWYHITEWLGYVPLLMAIVYAFLGFIQLIKRKNILKVDKEIIILGVFYVILACLYVFFEKFIINYRPILVDGLLEASYPSSHTMMTIFLCGSSIIVNKKLFNNKKMNLINILLLIVMFVVVIGRLISGYHWFTDIIGGIFISMALLMGFYTTINLIKNK